MNKFEYFKNFPMAKELDIAGRFIYSSMKKFCNLKNFYSETDIFFLLYDAAVGIERLQKVLLVVSEEFDESNIKDFEHSLITHSHQKLHEQISRSFGLKFNNNQNSFLNMITTFYKSCRYDRFTLSDSYHKEKDLLVEYLSKGLSCEIVANGILDNTANNIQFKKFFCKNLGTIASSYYKLIVKKARELNIYTYELIYSSDASKIFYFNHENNAYHEIFVQEERIKKEFLVFLINKADDTECGKYIKSIPPLELDNGLYNNYINMLISDSFTLDETDVIESEYEYGIDNPMDRCFSIDIVGESNICFETEEEYD